MTDARIRLLKAREALKEAEKSVGLHDRNAITKTPAHTTPVLEGPQNRSDLVRLIIEYRPESGWVGLCGVTDIGWEWAAQQGMDLERVLVLNDQRDGRAAQLCALLMDACDVVCLDLPELTGSEQRSLAARARSRGRTIITLRPWPGISRSIHLRRDMMLVV